MRILRNTRSNKKNKNVEKKRNVYVKRVEHDENNNRCAIEIK